MNDTEPMPLDAGMQTALIGVAALGLLGALLGAWLWSWRAALGIACGGLLATMNLWLFARVVQGVLSGGAGSRKWGLLGVLKFLGLLGGAWALLQGGWVDGLPLAAGYVALPLGVALASLVRPKE